MAKRRPLKTLSLFTPPKSYIPLAERVRPKSFHEFIGQEHLVGTDGTLLKMVKSGSLRSMILWGPPGTGKTTLAWLIAQNADAEFHQINAVSSGVKEIRDIIEEAQKSLEIGRRTILFIDEIHRFNKAQQDALLSSVENGTIVLIGATTENPSFEVISPLLSRTSVYVLDPLTDDELNSILTRAMEKDDLMRGFSISDEAKEELIVLSGRDARVMLNALEIAVTLAKRERIDVINREHVREAYQVRHFKYDRVGEEHYNTISAFIKSVRGSDPDAAVYYLARMLEAGEDPKFIARRLIILASEDIGNAEPHALTLATSCFTAVTYVGMPEASLILSQATTYLASCPKSNASCLAITEAREDVRRKPYIPIPLHLRNAPTEFMKELGYGKGYKYSHEYEGHFVEQKFLPEELEDKIYYRPTEIGREAQLKKHLETLWKKRRTS
jgi:putative ATPase